MDRKLEKKSGLPYYVQLKDILRSQIESGELTGRRLPPIRDLAKEYGISVNTVLRAYEGLRQEGITRGTIGKGTFITTTPQGLKRQNRATLLHKLIGHAVEEALSLEFTMEQFAQEVRKFVDEKQELMRKLKLVFIECNGEQLVYFTDHLELDPHIHRIPVLLEQLRREEERIMEEISGSDIITTSFYHLDEVEERLSSLGKPIMGINLEPEINTIIRIAKIPRESTVGIVTTSGRFGEIIRQVLEDLGLSFVRILEADSPDEETIRRIVGECDAVLVSPKRKRQVAEMAFDGSAVIEFVFTPDRTSINNLKVALLELRNESA
jgi:GntR family transcriptional regulator